MMFVDRLLLSNPPRKRLTTLELAYLRDITANEMGMLIIYLTIIYIN